MPDALLSPGIMEAGCDEAGRGCLAGPVFAAAVILPENCIIEGLTDSKQLTEKKRTSLRHIIEVQSVSFGVGEVSPAEIDEINILNASFLAMHRALDKLNQRPQQIVVDGNRFRVYHDIPHQCIVKGDSRYLSIAAASVLAKTYRDDHMKQLHKRFPEYHWDRNKGYPTKEHREAIHEKGITIHHRKSFRLTNVQLELDFRLQ
jgi:ribonuclease HII